MKFNVIKFLKAQLSVALATLLVTNEFFEEKIGRLLAIAFILIGFASDFTLMRHERQHFVLRNGGD